MNSIKISVIVPVYNSEKYLSECIRSILNQSLTDFELLLVNDGSLDESGNICNEYSKKDSRIRVFHKKNGGVSKARNFGLENARGEWVTFCDSDDLVEKGWLEDFAKHTQNFDLVTQGFYSETYPLCTNGILSIPSRVVKRGEITKYLYDMIKISLLGFLWCKSFKMSIINKYSLRFDEDLTWKEDEEFILRYCLYIDSVYHSYQANYHYNYEEKKYSSQDNFNLWVAIFKSTREIFRSDNYLYHKLKKEYLIPWFVYSSYKMYSDKRITKDLRLSRLNYLSANFGSSYDADVDMKYKVVLTILKLNASIVDRIFNPMFFGIRQLKNLKNLFNRR